MCVDSRSTLRVVILITVLAPAGGFIWALGVIGVAQYTEDICFDDLDGRRGYGGYNTASELWPPSYECRLLSNDLDPVVVQHRGVALARLAAIVGPPLGVGIAVVVGSLRRSQRFAKQSCP